jgi:phospholipase/carboxylesterase
MEFPSRNTHTSLERFVMIRTILVLLVTMLVCLPIIAIEPGGPTLGEQAEKALTAGETGIAAELYVRWLEAVPADFVGWYNYTCALAHEEKVEEALKAFEDAVTAGWRDFKWPSQDPDLEILYTEERFLKTLERINELVELEKLAPATSSKTYYIKQARLATYRMTLPSNYSEEDSPHPVLVLLHPRGGNIKTCEDLCMRLALPGMIHVMPLAPYSIENDRDSYEYWPRDISVSGNNEILEKAQELTAEWIENVIKDVVDRANGDASKVIIVGHSQGGAMVYVALSHAPGMYLGGAALGGFLPRQNQDTFDFAPLAKENVALFVGHGSRDRVIELERAEYAVGKAEAAGVEVTKKIYPSEHNIPDEMVVDLAEWVSKLLEETGK